MAIKMTLLIEGRVGIDFPKEHFKDEATTEKFKKNSIKAIREKMGLSDSVKVVLTILNPSK
ncbi:MAG: hypothetical protein ABIH42_04240 [Planctomycetota bacterium]